MTFYPYENGVRATPTDPGAFEDGVTLHIRGETAENGSHTVRVHLDNENAAELAGEIAEAIQEGE